MAKDNEDVAPQIEGVHDERVKHFKGGEIETAEKGFTLLRSNLIELSILAFAQQMKHPTVNYLTEKNVSMLRINLDIIMNTNINIQL